jgi:MarR family transcriptional regulator, transcriptional regulator for hemolysin
MDLNRNDSAGYLTNWAARLFAREADRKLAALGLSSGHLPVFFEQPTMAATLARMERDGLIRRKPDPSDGRSALVFLTPAALKKAAEVRKVVTAINGEALGALSGEERALFLQMLKRVITALEQAAD